ncbi:hypothetical protein [Metabacillus sp. Hm71]|uniref:hypothetical protein n=1 Tax=Metabacillus sp. Hm71 TaxID=3450743 RepID=UPI003F42E0C2
MMDQGQKPQGETEGMFFIKEQFLLLIKGVFTNYTPSSISNLPKWFFFIRQSNHKRINGEYERNHDEQGDQYCYPTIMNK